MMTKSETLYDMAATLRKRGFTPSFLFATSGRTCFIGALSLKDGPIIADYLLDVIGTDWFTAEDLVRAGWTEGCTDDAVAACEIAGDIAFEEERQ